MNIVDEHASPDRKLKLLVVKGNDSEVAIGFEGGDWHTHPDLIHHWLSVPESTAVQFFISALCSDYLPIIVSTDGGITQNPWVSDNLQQTLEMYG